MKLNRYLSAGVAVLVLCAGTALAYTFKYDSSISASPTATSQCDCLLIPGVARTLSTWTITASGSNDRDVSNKGWYGAQWPGTPGQSTTQSQYPICTILPVNANDDVINGYKCRPGGANNEDLSVDWDAVHKSGGSASQYIAGTPWWWHPTVNITDDRPLVEWRSGSLSSWQNIGLTADADPDPINTPNVNENDQRTAVVYNWKPDPANPTTAVLPNAGPSISGNFEGTTTVHNHQVNGQVRVSVKLHITVGGSGDDVTVSGWMVYVDAELKTSMQ